MGRVNYTQYEGDHGTSSSQSQTSNHNGIEGLQSHAYVGSWSSQWGAALLNDLNGQYVVEQTPRLPDPGLSFPEIRYGSFSLGATSFPADDRDAEAVVGRRHRHVPDRQPRRQGRRRVQQDLDRAGLQGQLARRLRLRREQPREPPRRQVVAVLPVRRPERARRRTRRARRPSRRRSSPSSFRTSGSSRRS